MKVMTYAARPIEWAFPGFLWCESLHSSSLPLESRVQADQVLAPCTINTAPPLIAHANQIESGESRHELKLELPAASKPALAQGVSRTAVRLPRLPVPKRVGYGASAKLLLSILPGDLPGHPSIWGR